MSFLKFIEKTQEKMLNKSEEIAKKLGATQEQLQNNPTEALTEFIKKNSFKETNPKIPDSSNDIEDITKQILKQRDSFRKNGFKEYTFLANKGCCAECQQLHNKHFPVSKLKIGVNAPPMHEGCRCSIAAYSDRKEYEKWLNSL